MKAHQTASDTQKAKAGTSFFGERAGASAFFAPRVLRAKPRESRAATMAGVRDKQNRASGNAIFGQGRSVLFTKDNLGLVQAKTTSGLMPSPQPNATGLAQHDAQEAFAENALEVGSTNSQQQGGTSPFADIQGMISRVQHSAETARIQIGDAQKQSVQTARRARSKQKAALGRQKKQCTEQVDDHFDKCGFEVEEIFVEARKLFSGMSSTRLATLNKLAKEAMDDVGGQFDGYPGKIQEAIDEGKKDGEKLRDEYVKKSQDQNFEKRREANRLGIAYVRTYPQTNRGHFIRNAIYDVTFAVQDGILEKGKEATAAVGDLFSPIPAELEASAQMFLQGYDEDRPKIERDLQIGHIEAVLNLGNKTHAGLVNLDKSLFDIKAQLAEARRAVHRRIDENVVKAEQEMDAVVGGIQRAVRKSPESTLEQIASMNESAVDVLSNAVPEDKEELDEFVNQMIQFFEGSAMDCLAVLESSTTEFSEKFEQPVSEARRNFRDIVKSVKTQTGDATASARTKLNDFLREANDGFQADETAFSDANKETQKAVKEGLQKAIDDYKTEVKPVFEAVRPKVDEALSDAGKRYDEALAELPTKMVMAAANAAFKWDHPVLHAIKYGIEWAGGLIVGILTVIALVIVAIVAFKVLVAGLVFLGLKAALATAIVAIAAIAVTGYAAYQVYKTKIAQGQSSGAAIWSTFKDFTGISDIQKSFNDPSLSPFEKGFSFGKGIATMATAVFGRRMDKAVSARLPKGLTSPRQGGLWERLRLRREKKWLAQQGYSPKPGERSMTRDAYKAQQRQVRIQKTGGRPPERSPEVLRERKWLEQQGTRPKARERSTTRAEYNAQQRQARTEKTGGRPPERQPEAQSTSQRAPARQQQPVENATVPPTRKTPPQTDINTPPTNATNAVKPHGELPQGNRIVEMADDYVVYENAAGELRIRFKAEKARTLQEATTGRNYSSEARATVNAEGQPYVLEGRHRAIGSAKGDKIPPERGGVADADGWLDYEYTPNNEGISGGRRVKDLEIDYSEPDVPLAEAEAMWEQKFGTGSRSKNQAREQKNIQTEPQNTGATDTFSGQEDLKSVPQSKLLKADGQPYDPEVPLPEHESSEFTTMRIPELEGGKGVMHRGSIPIPKGEKFVGTSPRDLLTEGKLKMSDLMEIVPKGTSNTFGRTADLPSGFKYKFRTKGYVYEIKAHLADINTQNPNVPTTANTRQGWTAQIKRNRILPNGMNGQGEYLETNGNWVIDNAQNDTHIPITDATDILP